MFRAPSERLRLTRRRAGEDMISGERLGRKAAIGLADREIIIRLNGRKHASAASRVARAFFCEDYAADPLELHAPQLSCPACRAWPAITRVARAGGGLSPEMAARKLLGEPRSFANARGWGNSESAGAHFLRRGAARAILAAGGSVSHVLRSRRRRSSAFRLYSGLVREEAPAATSVLIEASEDEH